MPLIAAIETPADSAYLVGSIQTYLTTRTLAAPAPYCVLERNYRSAEDIVAFARTTGYPSSLRAEYGNIKLHFLQPLPDQTSYPPHLPWCDAFGTLLTP